MLLGSELFLKGRKPDGKIGSLKHISRNREKLTRTCSHIVKWWVLEGKQARSNHLSGSNCFWWSTLSVILIWQRTNVKNAECRMKIEVISNRVLNRARRGHLRTCGWPEVMASYLACAATATLSSSPGRCPTPGAGAAPVSCSWLGVGQVWLPGPALTDPHGESPQPQP